MGSDSQAPHLTEEQCEIGDLWREVGSVMFNCESPVDTLALEYIYGQYQFELMSHMCKNVQI